MSVTMLTKVNFHDVKR